MPNEPGRLRETPEVVGADVVLVDVGLADARGTRLDRESALLSANLTRTPSQTRKYVLIGETASALI
jgi:hypothetical protein